ncbi:LacI family DNA-binding transcriptional regulator [Streptomyces pathocidini]|uniref:LacI family DNA-binding transcriptional regulator n=1 Tax=Streptomyces pathocidini TaxID=1650571 RepID=A0ABW7V040_9ACTN|nr:LacI family DNA-binding transcriptional regulator [Streptomyces pathocidini]
MALTSGRGRPAPGGSATISDVAGAAGVSRQTVSNVLNAPHRVRPGTRERVERVIAELGYHPNRVARSLRASSPGMVGYRIQPVATESVAGIHDRFLHALSEAGEAGDHHVLLFTAPDIQGESERCAHLWRTGAVSGVVLYDLAPHDPRPAQLAAAGVPFAAFGRTASRADRYSWVDVDNAAGTAAAVEHLVGAGHRRIGFLGWPEGSSVGDARARGWLAAMDSHGLLAASHRLDVRGPDTVSSGTRLMTELLDRPEPPTAVVAATDTLGVGAFQAVRDHGLRPGRDVALVGFDDTPAADAIGLSSLRQPIEAVGGLVMAGLFHCIASGGVAVSSRLLEPELIVRVSSAAG